MLSRTFTVDKGTDDPLECYKGFNQNFNGPVPFIAVVQYEDSIESWALDNDDEALSQLREYLLCNKDEAQRLVGVFKAHKNTFQQYQAMRTTD